MNILERKPRAQSQRPSPDSMQAASATIVFNSTGIQAGGLRVHWPSLDDGDARELVELTDKLAKNQSGQGDKLTRGEQKDWERLVERGASMPGAFQKVRDDDKMRREFSKLAAEANRRPFSRRETKSLIGEMASGVADGSLWIGHVGVLTAVLIAFEAGRPLGDGSYFEGGWLHFDKRIGLFGSTDGDSMFTRTQGQLEHLALNQWIELDNSGLLWRIRLGERATDAMDGPS